MKRVSGIALASAVVMFSITGIVHADSAVDMVVTKMAKGDVSAICSGGRETITEASKDAVTALARAGEISGNFQEIGKAAGTEFYKTKC